MAPKTDNNNNHHQDVSTEFDVLYFSVPLAHNTEGKEEEFWATKNDVEKYDGRASNQVQTYSSCSESHYCNGFSYQEEGIGQSLAPSPLSVNKESTTTSTTGMKSSTYNGSSSSSILSSHHKNKKKKKKPFESYKKSFIKKESKISVMDTDLDMDTYYQGLKGNHCESICIRAIFGNPKPKQTTNSHQKSRSTTTSTATATTNTKGTSTSQSSLSIHDKQTKQKQHEQVVLMKPNYVTKSKAKDPSKMLFSNPKPLQRRPTTASNTLFV